MEKTLTILIGLSFEEKNTLFPKQMIITLSDLWVSMAQQVKEYGQSIIVESNDVNRLDFLNEFPDYKKIAVVNLINTETLPSFEDGFDEIITSEGTEFPLNLNGRTPIWRYFTKSKYYKPINTHIAVDVEIISHLLKNRLSAPDTILLSNKFTDFCDTYYDYDFIPRYSVRANDIFYIPLDYMVLCDLLLDVSIHGLDFYISTINHKHVITFKQKSNKEYLYNYCKHFNLLNDLKCLGDES